MDIASTLTISPDGLCFAAPAANLGIKDLGLRLAVDGQTSTVRYGAVTPQASGVSATGTVLPGLSVTTTLVPVPGLAAAVATHTLTNTTARELRVTAAATGQFAPGAAVLAGKSNGLGWDLRFAHTDNVRIERYPHCLMEYPWLRMLPVTPTVLGAGEDQPFPALYLVDERGRHGLVLAAATQTLNYLVFALQKAAFTQGGMFSAFELRHEFGQAGGLTVPAGGSVVLDSLFLQVTPSADLNHAYDDYLAYVAAHHPLRGAHTRLLTEAMHCTWNYGVFADQKQEPLLKTARCISQQLPGIKWFLMDAGYLAGDISTTFIDRFYPNPNARVSPQSFPQGIRGFSDALRALGLRPGIWWSPTAQIDGALYQDHPDWFLRRADGSLYLIGEKNAFLDYSHPGALAFLDRTLAVIFGEWGMDACKMDFWSQNFEDRSARLFDPGMTAVQARTRFFEVIRRHLPPDGVFMTCVATGMGNPFIGQWADTYRNTIDIGVGVWHEQRLNCCWALPTLLHAGRQSFLLNNDSVGANLAAPANENYFRFTWSFINQGMVETGGRMEQWPPEYLEAMRRCTTQLDRGHAVRCVDEQAFTGQPFPRVLVVEYPADSATARRGVRLHLALFNWEDTPQMVGATHAQLGLSGAVTLRDFWTDEQKHVAVDALFELLPGRTARLYELSR